jgi:hypothetical protein
MLRKRTKYIFLAGWTTREERMWGLNGPRKGWRGEYVWWEMRRDDTGCVRVRLHVESAPTLHVRAHDLHDLNLG